MKVLKFIARIVADLFTSNLSPMESADCERRFPRIVAHVKRGILSGGEARRLYRRLSGGEVMPV